jgi:hypothetical protein
MASRLRMSLPISDEMKSSVNKPRLGVNGERCERAGDWALAAQGSCGESREP